MKISASRRKIFLGISQGILVMMRPVVRKLYTLDATQLTKLGVNRRRISSEIPQLLELLTILVSGIVYHSRRSGIAARHGAVSWRFTAP